MFDPRPTSAADPPDGAPPTHLPATIHRRPVATIHRIALSHEREPSARYTGPSPWRAPKRVTVSLWSTASRQAERPPARRLAA
jgi:hypothetical protein